MSNSVRVVIVAIVVLAAGGVLVLKNRDATNIAAPRSSGNTAAEPTVAAQSRPATQTAAAAECVMPPTPPGAPTAATSSAPATAASQPAKLPKLVDLGATKCIPCKMMAPILEELKRENAGRLEVVFIDVWENRKAIGQYGISTIPTQIFYDAAGKERFRHEGFFAKEDILAQWKELGVVLRPAK